VIELLPRDAREAAHGEPFAALHHGIDMVARQPFAPRRHANRIVVCAGATKAQRLCIEHDLPQREEALRVFWAQFHDIHARRLTPAHGAIVAHHQ